MKRSQRIKRICELQRLGEHSAAKTMREARQKLATARQLFAELEQHRERYRAALKEAENTPQAALLWRGQCQFLRALEEAIAQQLTQIVQRGAHLDYSQDAWRQRHAETQAVETFLERLRAKELRHEERRTTRAEDEWAIGKHSRRRSTEPPR